MDSCAVCSQAMQGNSRRRYCGNACKQAAAQARRQAKATARRVAARDTAGVGLLAAVRRAIVGREDEPITQQALLIASRLEGCEESPSGTAALSKELRSTLDYLKSTGSTKADPVDELRARRERRHRAG